MNQGLAAQIRNLFTLGTLSRRDGATIQGTTQFGRTVEGQELHPYGFAARPKTGTVVFLFEGGDVRSPTLLYVSNQEGVPDLQEGDSALWTEAGGWVVARNEGTVELNGTSAGGLVLVETLKTELAKNNQILQAILTTLQTPVMEPGSGAPSAFQLALKTALAGKAVGNFSSIASAKVFHGDGTT